ncbi:hypothetical protein VTI74DRAFT_11622 [Chaetomium olivicolor]
MHLPVRMHSPFMADRHHERESLLPASRRPVTVSSTGHDGGNGDLAVVSCLSALQIGPSIELLRKTASTRVISLPELSLNNRDGTAVRRDPGRTFQHWELISGFSEPSSLTFDWLLSLHLLGDLRQDGANTGQTNISGEATTASSTGQLRRLTCAVHTGLCPLCKCYCGLIN